MISKMFNLSGLAAMAVAVSMVGAAAAQTSIRVEESTSTVVRKNADQPIEIHIPKSKSDVNLSPSAATESIPRGKASGDSIDLTPSAFKKKPQPTKIPDVVTTRAVVIPKESKTATPAGIPVPTTNPVGKETVKTDKDTAKDQSADNEPAKEKPAKEKPAKNDSANDESPADTVTTKTKTAKAPSKDRPAAPPDKKSNAKEDFLPPANLGQNSTMKRGGQTLPLRPELLTSATLNVTIPDVYGTTLTNGIRFYHYENHDLPRIRVSLLVKAGNEADPADKVGLAELTARSMRAGGAAGKSGDEIDEQLEQIGSDLEFSVDRDHVAGSLFALTDKADEAMGLLADVLMKPEFNAKKFKQQRARSMEDLRRQNDQPDDISRREFRKIIYGADALLARTPTSATIGTITRDDLRAFHDARYRPSTLWIGISGDITQEDARKLVEKYFGAWNRPEAESIKAETADTDRDSTGGVYLTEKATAQSQIRLGHFGIPRRSPKAYAVNVLNSIYGTGGFSSRLMNSVRTKHGYVYGVGGGIFSDDPVGLFAGVAASKTKTTIAAIKDILRVTKSLVDGPISKEEVDTARRDIIFTFVNQFDTPAEAVSTHMIYDYRGYAPDYLKTFPEHIRNVDVADVKAVAKELLQPDHIKIYVIGNKSEMDGSLSQFGPVREWTLPVYK